MWTVSSREVSRHGMSSQNAVRPLRTQACALRPQCRATNEAAAPQNPAHTVCATTCAPKQPNDREDKQTGSSMRPTHYTKTQLRNCVLQALYEYIPGGSDRQARGCQICCCVAPTSSRKTAHHAMRTVATLSLKATSFICDHPFRIQAMPNSD